ncbi:MAG TPA: hypothetical protein VGE22_14305 [Solimonas sp.]
MTNEAARALGAVAVLLYADTCRRRADEYDQNAALALGRGRPAAAAAFRMRAADFRREAASAESASNTGLLAQNDPLSFQAADAAPNGISDLADSGRGVTFGSKNGGSAA